MSKKFKTIQDIIAAHRAEAANLAQMPLQSENANLVRARLVSDSRNEADCLEANCAIVREALVELKEFLADLEASKCPIETGEFGYYNEKIDNALKSIGENKSATQP